MYEKVKVTGSSPQGRGNEGDCDGETCGFCNRSKCGVVCNSCFKRIDGVRVRRKCSKHPKEMFLMDLVKCPNCKSEQLSEVGRDEGARAAAIYKPLPPPKHSSSSTMEPKKKMEHASECPPVPKKFCETLFDENEMEVDTTEVFDRNLAGLTITRDMNSTANGSALRSVNVTPPSNTSLCFQRAPVQVEIQRPILSDVGVGAAAASTSSPYQRTTRVEFGRPKLSSITPPSQQASSQVEIGRSTFSSITPPSQTSAQVEFGRLTFSDTAPPSQQTPTRVEFGRTTFSAITPPLQQGLSQVEIGRSTFSPIKTTPPSTLGRTEIEKPTFGASLSTRDGGRLKARTQIKLPSSAAEDEAVAAKRRAAQRAKIGQQHQSFVPSPPVQSPEPAPTQEFEFPNKPATINCPCIKEISYLLCVQCGYYAPKQRKYFMCHLHNKSGGFKTCPECHTPADDMDEGDG